MQTAIPYIHLEKIVFKGDAILYNKGWGQCYKMATYGIVMRQISLNGHFQYQMQMPFFTLYIYPYIEHISFDF